MKFYSYVVLKIGGGILRKQGLKEIGEEGFEPTTPASRTLCANQAALLPEG